MPPRPDQPRVSRRELIRRASLGLTAGAASTLARAPACVAGDDRPEGPNFEATGFFRVARVGPKWTAIGPRGEPVYLRGLNHYGDGTHMPLNLERRHGDRSAWRRSIRDRHRAWGFNYLPPSVGPSEPQADVVPPVANERGGVRWLVDIRRTPEWPADHFAALDFPFAAFLEVPRQYMAGTGLPDVFSGDFRRQVDRRCREFAAPLADDPNLVGYHFTQNPPWHHSVPSFDTWIADIVSQPDGRREWAGLMRRIYGSVDRWRQTYGIPIDDFDQIPELVLPLRGFVSEQRALRDRIAFMERVCEEWYRVYAEAIRRHDPNHLLLGDRNTAHLHPLPEFAVRIMGRHVDVISINVMGPAETFYDTMEQVTAHWDGPILLADTGAGIYGGDYPKSTYQCRDLEEFEQLYRSYMEAGLDHPQLVGFGWCGYYETPTSRSGIVDSRDDEPLDDRVAVMAKWNAWMQQQYPRRLARYGGRAEG